MACKNGIAIAVAAMLFCALAHAGDTCVLTLKPETSGSFLNPILVRVIVAKATPQSAGQTCPIRANDEILQINDRLIPGQRAKMVMNYWKSLKPDAPRVFKIKRGHSVITLTAQ